MNKLYMYMLTILLAIAAGCGSTQNIDRETVGSLAGAALGGLAGSQFGDGTGQLAATGVGVLLGSLAGSEVGRRMDDRDRMAANDAIVEAQSAPIGEEITWNNPGTDRYGTITPTRDGYSESGNYCREFHQTINIDGRTESATGVACRQDDGTWRIVES